MEGGNHTSNYLVVNRVEVLTENCNCCGGGFVGSHGGEKALVAAVSGAGQPYFFCASCGDNIMGRIQSEEARKHYVWDWVVPLKQTKAPVQPG